MEPGLSCCGIHADMLLERTVEMTTISSYELM